MTVARCCSHGTQKCSSDTRKSNEMHSCYDFSGLNWKRELPVILMPTMAVCKGKVSPRFIDTRQMKVVRSSPLRTDRLYPQEYPGTHF
jgi:hypothetical protein